MMVAILLSSMIITRYQAMPVHEIFISIPFLIKEHYLSKKKNHSTTLDAVKQQVLHQVPSPRWIH